MTVRPKRPDTIDSLGEIYTRGRSLERESRGPWVYVGLGLLLANGTFLSPLPDGLPVPVFQNGWSNVGGGLQQMRFCWLFAGGVEIQGSVTGGIPGSVIFTLPNDPRYQPDDGDLRFTALNDANGLVAIALLANGDVQHLAG